MFAVPGWSVPAGSLVQQETGGQKREASHEPHEDTQIKKRKRADEPKLSSTELERLWNRSLQKATTRAGKSSKIRNENTGSEKVRRQAEEADLRKPGKTPKRQEKKEQPRPHSSSTIPKTRVGDLEKQDKSNPIAPQSASPHAPKQKKKNEKLEARKNAADKVASKSSPPAPKMQPPPPNLPQTATLTPLQAKMRSKLTSARFRHLNQTLYTSSSADALALFKASPDLFAEYHAGFSQQVKDAWPQNPVEQYIRTIKQRGEVQEGGSNTKGLPRRKTGSCTIADLGCGDAPLARGCQSQIKALKLKFHSFDLHAPNTLVTVADIANLPLRDGEVDIAIFCLSLMGTNWITFVEEAWRVLRGDGKGEVWVAEVKSRFGRVTKGRVVENSVGKKKQPKKEKTSDEVQLSGTELFAENDTTEGQLADETDISAFAKVFQRRGFTLQEDSVQKGNKMFVTMVFTKSGVPTTGKHQGLKWSGREYQKIHDGKMRYVNGVDEDVSLEDEARTLKPCVYKTR